MLTDPSQKLLHPSLEQMKAFFTPEELVAIEDQDRLANLATFGQLGSSLEYRYLEKLEAMKAHDKLASL